MEINGSNIGASTYAMKKAMEMPKILQSLAQDSAAHTKPSLEMKTPTPQSSGILAVPGTGKILDLVI